MFFVSCHRKQKKGFLFNPIIKATAFVLISRWIAVPILRQCLWP